MLTYQRGKTGSGLHAGNFWMADCLASLQSRIGFAVNVQRGILFATVSKRVYTKQ